MPEKSDWFTFELDLDNMCLLLHGYPILKLQPQMPSASLIAELHAACRTNSYGHPFSLGQSIPDKYRFDVVRGVPVCDVHDDALLRYAQHAPTILSEPYEVLSIPSSVSTSEETSVTFCENLLGIYIHCYGPDLLRHIVLAGSHLTLSPHEKSLALRFVLTALCPNHASSSAFAPQSYWIDPDQDCNDAASSWWLRQHICVTLASHLHSERNYQAAISHLVDDILRNDSASAVTFGVAFSVLHCVIVRVNKHAAGTVSVACTHALDFLPDLRGDSGSTPGIQAVARLGYMSASDDIYFFHSVLCSIPYAVRKRSPRPETRAQKNQHTRNKNKNNGKGKGKGKKSKAVTAQLVHEDHDFAKVGSLSSKASNSASTNAKTILDLPAELILYIAQHLPHPRDLNGLAVTCTSLMDACLPLLRLTQLLDIDGAFTETFHRTALRTLLMRFSGPSDVDFDDYADDYEPAGFILTHVREVLIEARWSRDVQPDVYAREFWTTHPTSGRTDVALLFCPKGTVDLGEHIVPFHGADYPPLGEYESMGTISMLDLEAGWELEKTDAPGDQQKTAVAEFQAWYWPRQD